MRMTTLNPILTPIEVTGTPGSWALLDIAVGDHRGTVLGNASDHIAAFTAAHDRGIVYILTRGASGHYVGLQVLEMSGSRLVAIDGHFLTAEGDPDCYRDVAAYDDVSLAMELTLWVSV